MDKNIATLSELIEHSAEVTKLLISNGIDMENGDIYMVLPSGEYAISSKLGSDGIYRLDLKNNGKSPQL